MPLEQIVADRRRSALCHSRSEVAAFECAQSEPNAEFVCTLHNNKIAACGCGSGCGSFAFCIRISRTDAGN